MRIVVSGASGLVGRALCPALTGSGHEVQRLSRGKGGSGFCWNAATGELDREGLNAWGPEVLVHLAGENLASGRWGEERKRKIRESRVLATQKLADAVLALKERPRVFLGASAVGYYGSDRGEEVLTEESAPGQDFLAEVCQGWEQAAERLTKAGIRVVHLRFGMILSAGAGALERMLPIFKLGLGGRLGSGRQWMSWIALQDVVRVVQWALSNHPARGAYNVCSPNPVRNGDFARELGKAIHRPAFVPAPGLALRLAFGEMADALLLGSERVVPKRLTDEGFKFELPKLAEALCSELRSN